MRKEDIAYRLGGLLYMPPFQENIIEKIRLNSIPYLTSIAFCLEDAIEDNALEAAETALRDQLIKLAEIKEKGAKLPFIFVRIRNPEHLSQLHMQLGIIQKIVTGYILPKFSCKNAEKYLKIAQNEKTKGHNMLFMPVLETQEIANIITRTDELSYLKAKIDDMKDNILCVRVGGNDFSQIYGLRCPPNHTIHELRLVDDILNSILSVFASDYIVSGPVRNYFADIKSICWQKFYKKELIEDRLMGFIGKTAIHPAQLPLIYDSLRVTKEEYEEAKSLINWHNKKLGVAKSKDGGMSEVKCQSHWAKKILNLAEIYGIRKEENI